MYNATVAITAVLVALGSMSIVPAAMAQEQQLEAINAITGGFESITVAQDANQIVITITKTGGEPGEPGDNVTVPTDPIIIVPPNNETGQNGTIIVPPLENQTSGNVTLPTEPPVIIVDPAGNNTVVQPPSNVTVIDNGTVVVHPPAQNVTETPGNVTVVDPPVGNVTAPEPCACPPPVVESPTLPINETSSQPVQPIIENDTVIVQQPAAEDGSGGGGDGNGDGNGGGE